MREIPLTNSQLVTLVDDEDYELLAENRWQLSTSRRGSPASVVRTVSFGRRRRVTLLMHRVIMNASDESEVDHRNRNPLDNRKMNLRLATHANNMHNQPGKSGTTSRFKGVWWFKERQRWVAQIRANGERECLGYFLREEDAAVAYNNAALRLHGEFAYLNPVVAVETVKPAMQNP